jgi:hypothetical protein
MKKYLLILVIVSFTKFTFSQQNYSFKIDAKCKTSIQKEETSSSKKIQIIKPILAPNSREVDIVDVIDIGSSVNVNDMAANLSSLWVDPNLNTVSFYHRMGGIFDPGGNADDFGYDISKDGGQTWDLMIRNFYSGEITAGYSNHGIFNPEGNTNPDDAYEVFSLTGSDGQNVGYVHGVSSIGDTSIHNQVFEGGYSYTGMTPNAFDINANGDVFNVVFKSGDVSESDSLLISRGIWNESTNNFIYQNSAIEANTLFGPVDIKIAFGEDGQTGYITMLGNNGMADQISGSSNLYPIYWKSTDGGESWEGPEIIQLDGPYGLNCIVNSHLTDELIFELFGENPPERTEISYTTAYDHDITVDKNDDLHIAVVIGPTGADPYSIVTAKGYLAVWDFRMLNSMETWCPVYMGGINNFRGSFGDIDEENRVQITKDKTAGIVFVSWLDTDMPDVEENNSPNIWCRGFNISTYSKTVNSNGEDAPTNVTLFSDGMWKSYFANAPKYAFTNDIGMNIPFVYAHFENEDFTGEVTYKYVQDFYFNESNFHYGGGGCPCGIVSTTELEQNNNFLVSQNSPNPFHSKTTFEIELNDESDIRLDVFSVDGKMIFSKVYNSLPSGKSKIEFIADGLNHGIYFYSFTNKGVELNGKMIIK